MFYDIIILKNVIKGNGALHNIVLRHRFFIWKYISQGLATGSGKFEMRL